MIAEYKAYLECLTQRQLVVEESNLRELVILPIDYQIRALAKLKLKAIQELREMKSQSVMST